MGGGKGGVKIEIMEKFKFLEDIATADVAFEAYGKNLAELFENAGLALFETMVETKRVRPVSSLQLAIANTSVEDLLFDFLSELIFLKDSRGMVFGRFRVKISGKYNLEGEVFGEGIDPGRHRLKVDVKAVTLHRFKIEKTKEGYKAKVVLDI